MRLSLLFIITLTIAFISCDEHDKVIIVLKETENQSDVIYRTSGADFYFEKSELLEYCEKENDGEPNDFTYPQIIEYITKFEGDPIIITDTLGTKMSIENDIMSNYRDTLMRVRDQSHPYAYITDDIRWAVIDFVRKGNLRIYHQESKDFLDSVILDKVDTDWYGETNITLLNDSIIFSQLRWIK